MDTTVIEKEFSSLVDSSISTIGTAISGNLYWKWHDKIGLSSEYKHLDELYKMMILKLKDIHQKVCVEGNDWYDQRSELCNHFSCFWVVVDSLTPFFSNVEELQENSENLVKMLTKIDAYTKSLEKRAEALMN